MTATPLTRDDLLALDADDPLAVFRAGFEPPPPGRIFLDANSIGPMPRDAPARIVHAMRAEWSAHRRHAWHVADWLDAPQRIGAAYAPLLGARPEDVIATDNTTINLAKLLGYGLSLASLEAPRNGAARDTIVHERDGFPTDSHVVQGVVHHGGGRWKARAIDGPEDLEAALGPDVAMLVLSHADYRSSRRWDMARVNAAAHRHGARVLWDLSHTAGVVPVELDANRADFAVACGYKYLCAGPGAPALAWIRADLQDRAWPAIPGWLGHAERLDFLSDYAPAKGMLSLVGGTMPVLQDVVMECAARLWASVPPASIFARHRSLSTTLARLMHERCGTYGVELSSPAQYDRQGGHLAFRCPGGGATCEAMLDAGVTTSFRQPDVIRFGLSPAALTHADLWEAVERLRAILATERWREPRFQAVSI